MRLCRWAATAGIVFLGLGPQMALANRPVRWTLPVSPAASSRRKEASAKIHQATGEVLAVTPGRLVLLHARGRTKQRMAFTLTPETRESIHLMKGERIRIFYREIGGSRIAARIRKAPPARRTRRSRPAKTRG